MEIILDKDNYFNCDLEYGGRITKLVLGGHLVLKAGEDPSDLGYGNFLMFPWISKVAQNPYNPLKKNQYHGFVMNTKRSIVQKKQYNNKISLSLSQTLQRQNQHNFVQTYILSKGSLQILFEVIVNQQDKLPFCFGYHPYLQIDNQSIDELSIKSDINTLLKFDQNTLPYYPFIQQKVEIKSKHNYNNLFKGGSYLELISSRNTHLRISTDLPFWQIYTPEQKSKIAVEPASFCGNLYQIYQKNPDVQLPKKGMIQINVWDD